MVMVHHDAYMLAGLRLATSYAIGASVLTEMLTSNRGLGYMIQFSALNFDTPSVFATLGVVTCLSLAGDYLLGSVAFWFIPWTSRRSWCETEA